MRLSASSIKDSKECNLKGFWKKYFVIQIKTAFVEFYLSREINFYNSDIFKKYNMPQKADRL